jgi:aspartate beta-hydroxylase
MATGVAEDPRIAGLARQAEAEMQAGRLEAAAGLWESVLALAPGHAKALLHLGQHALYRKNPRGAQELLQRAAAADPANPVVPLNLSFTFAALGDAAGEMAALTRALTIDPYFLPALLARAAWFERGGKTRQAAKIYKDVLTIVPPDARVEPWLAERLAHAREVVERNRAALAAHLETRLDPIRAGAGLGQSERARFEESREVMIGARKIFLQQPTLLHYPRLPAIPFYERGDFPWLAEVEAASDMIRGELAALLAEQGGDFSPYVRHPDGVPLHQWAELNHSPKWSAYFLWQNGQAIADHTAQCPGTTALLARLPLADVPGIAPAAFFSNLEPKTRIPPHSGVTNARLIVHLPLIVPPGCWFRVGNETREWVPGQALIFDDTIEHEAWNGSDQPRIILIFDIWNPLLSPAEQALVRALLVGVEDYYAE